MSPLEQRNLIIRGFEPGNNLVWNKSQNCFEVYSKKEARKKSDKTYEVTLEKVCSHVQDFFIKSPDVRTVAVTEAIQKRVAPYRGWYGWVLWLTFRCSVLKRILGQFDFLLEAVAGGPLVAAPKGGIKMGITNLGNSCWFNSALKFLASTTVFDAGFNTNNSELSQLFGVAINELRLGKQGVLPSSLLDKLKEVVEENFQRFSLSRQCDSDEFIRALMNEIWDASGQEFESREMLNEQMQRFFYQATNVYTPKGHEVPKTLQSEGLKGVLILRLEQHDLDTKDPIDLSELLSRDDPLEAEGVDWQNHLYIRNLRFTHLPDELVINLQRGVRVGSQLGREVKCSRPVKMDPNSCLTFPLYEVWEGELQHVEDVPYRIEAAIIHYGGQGGGHYVCKTRNPDGTLTYHSDTAVRRSEDPIGQDGVYFYLKKNFFK